MAHAGLAPARWAGRRVLVTGHSGFVGSWLTTLLLGLGAEVVGYSANADEDTKARDAWLGELGATGIAGDVRDFEALRAAMASRSFDVVVHLAAQPLVCVGHAEPRMTLETNITGSVNVLEAARLCGPQIVLHVTSDKCYRNRAWPWPYREVDELGGGCPYSVSKAAAELVFEGYAQLYAAGGASAPRAASVRFGNVIGGGDFASNRLVPDCLSALATAQPMRLREPAAVRPWQHVLDVVHGLVLLADAFDRGAVLGGEVFNFAPPGDGATTSRLVSALAFAWGAELRTSVAAADFAEDQLLRLDGRKAAAFGWRHRFDIEESAEWIVRWHRSVLAGATPLEATRGQVAEFLALTTGEGAVP